MAVREVVPAGKYHENYASGILLIFLYGYIIEHMIYLFQRRGPQRSVDIIVSATFIACFMLIFFFSVELLKV